MKILAMALCLMMAAPVMIPTTAEAGWKKSRSSFKRSSKRSFFKRNKTKKVKKAKKKAVAQKKKQATKVVQKKKKAKKQATKVVYRPYPVAVGQPRSNSNLLLWVGMGYLFLNQRGERVSQDECGRMGDQCVVSKPSKAQAQQPAKSPIKPASNDPNELVSADEIGNF